MTSRSAAGPRPAARRRNTERDAGPSQELPAGAGFWSTAAAAALALVVLTLLVYLPALRLGFIWDDDTHLTRNIVIEPDGLWRSWFTTEQPNYWPITWTATWIQFQLWGLKPFGYHLVNVLLHAANAVLLWRVLLRLAVPGAWIAALLFAVHPVNVEAAGWVTQLKSLLAMLFYLSSLICYLRGEDEKRRGLYIASIPLFLMGMLSKPSIVTLPVVLLLMAWWRRGRIGRSDLVRSLPFFAIAGVLSLTEIWFQYNRSIQDTVVRTDGLISRLAGAGWVVWFYASKVFAPIDLMFVYPRREYDVSKGTTWLPLLALVVLFGVAWWKRAGWGRPVLFAAGYFCVTLLPVLGFLNIFYMRYSFVADHWQYQSMPALVALAAGSGVYLARQKWSRPDPRIIASSSLVVFVLSGLTMVHLQAYRSPEHLWRETLRKNPTAWIAHQCLGEELSRQERLDDAIGQFQAQVKLGQNLAEAHYNLGVAYAKKGDAEAALSHYRTAIQLNPRSSESFNNAGLLLTDLKRYDEAIQSLEQAIRVRPDFAGAYVNWGLALAGAGRHEEAMARYAKALELDPKSDEAYTNLAGVLLTLKRPVEAVPHLEKAAQLAPDPSSYFNLAHAWMQAGQPEKAIPHFETALRLNPNHAKARGGLARAHELLSGRR